MYLFPKKYLYSLVLVCISLACISALLSWFVGVKKSVVLHTIREQLYVTRVDLLRGAELTSRNQVDDDVSAVIPDCAVRGEYEAMLSSLHAARSTQELNTALRLYEVCGDFYAQRKRLMVAKMRMYVDELAHYVRMYSEFSGSNRYAKENEIWITLLEAETNRSNLFTEQTRIQGDIIRALVLNPHADLSSMIARAEEISQSLDVQYIQIEELKKKEAVLWSNAGQN